MDTYTVTRESDIAASPERVRASLVDFKQWRQWSPWESLDPVVGPSAVYDVVSGLVAELRADAGFDRAACLASNLADTPTVDPRPGPGLGEAFYYLVRGSNSCGTGTYGDSSLTPDLRDLLDAGTPACH